MSNLVKRSAARIPAKSVTDQIERELFAQAEINYMSGATALMQQEIALVQQSLYHKPGYNRNWSWDHKAEARINGYAQPAQRYEWDTKPYGRGPYADEPEGRPVFRDASSNTILTERVEDPIGTKIVVRDDTIYQGYDPAGSRDKPSTERLLTYVE